MSYTLKHETPESHKEFTAVKSVVIELVDEANLYEMREAFNAFLAATGYTGAYLTGDEE
jgi:hypothetical protein